LPLDFSFFFIRNAAVPPINVPIIVKGSGTAVDVDGANARPQEETPVAKGDILIILLKPYSDANRVPLESNVIAVGLLSPVTKGVTTPVDEILLIVPVPLLSSPVP
jgi:hypothetical protein